MRNFMLKKTAQQGFEWGRLYRTKCFLGGNAWEFLLSFSNYLFIYLFSFVSFFFLAGMPLQREPITAFW